MTKEELSSLINKYLDGTATGEESYLVDRFYQKIQSDEPGWEKWTEEEKRILKQRLYKSIKSRIKQKRKVVFMWRGAAAVLLIIIGNLFVRTIVQNDRDSILEPEIKASVVVTAEGRGRTVLLEDGTYVYLKKGARLTYPQSFSEKVRKVELAGEALFDVHRDTLRPFSVYSGSVTTEVLGTIFSIRAVPGQSEIQVAVSSGKVRVRDEKRELGVLTRDEELTFDVRTKSVRMQESKPLEDQHRDPLEYKLVDVTMEEAARFIENRWRFRIDFANEGIRSCKVVASFYEKDSLEEVLAILCRINNVQYRIENQKVIIYGERCG